MRKVSGVIRILSFIVDYIIVSFPVILILVMYFKASENQADILFQLLFAVYGSLFMEYRKGSTIGKHIGKIKVVTTEDTRPTLLEYGMRELVKALYFIPFIGWSLALVSTVMIFFHKGRAIHDYIAKTKVIYVVDEVKP